MKLSKEQIAVTDWLKENYKINKDKVNVLTGHAGSGKTTAMKHLAENWTYGNIVFCAPTHSAANILSGNLKGRSVLTVAAALGLKRKVVEARVVFLPHGYSKIDNCSLVVVDEASMLSEQETKWIIEQANNIRDDTQILFVGDPAQLPPVKAHTSYVFNQSWPRYHFKKNHRQGAGNPILDMANDTREHGKNTSLKHKIPNITMTENNIASFYEEYPTGIALSATHAIKDRCNKIAKKALTTSNDDPFSKYEMLFLESPVASGDGPKNGKTVRITSHPEYKEFLSFHIWEMQIENKYIIKVPDKDERKKITRHLSLLAKEYQQPHSTEVQKASINREVEYITNNIVYASSGFAMTIHKSQGSTFEHVLLCVDGINKPPFKRQKINMIYTGITRASKTLIIGMI